MGPTSDLFFPGVVVWGLARGAVGSTRAGITASSKAAQVTSVAVITSGGRVEARWLLYCPRVVSGQEEGEEGQSLEGIRRRG